MQEEWSPYEFASYLFALNAMNEGIWQMPSFIRCMLFVADHMPNLGETNSIEIVSCLRLEQPFKIRCLADCRSAERSKITLPAN